MKGGSFKRRCAIEDDDAIKSVRALPGVSLVFECAKVIMQPNPLFTPHPRLKLSSTPNHLPP